VVDIFFRGKEMASDNSFDVVSKVEIQEVKNAIDQASKEVHARFDLKDSKSKIELEGNEVIQLASQDEYKLKAVIEILSQKLVKRGVSLKNLEFEKIEPAANSSVRQKVKLVQGIPSEKAKIIVAAIKDSGRHGAGGEQGQGHAAGGDGAAAGQGYRGGVAVYELPLQLKRWRGLESLGACWHDQYIYVGFRFLFGIFDSVPEANFTS
jgi:cyclic-di-GMP-binding protein